MPGGVVKSPARSRSPNPVNKERSATLNEDDIRAAAQIIRRAIAEAEGPLPPSFLLEFLIRDWRLYLASIHHRAGPRSIVLKEAEALTERLLLSVLPIESRESRTALMQGLPRLVTDVKLGMMEVGIAPERRDEFLNALRGHHLSLLEAPLPSGPATRVDLADTVAMNVFDPRYRELLDRLDGLDSLEHIEM